MSEEEKAVLQLSDFRRVLARWAEAMPDATSDERARDSAILRFELAYEVGWKVLQTLCQRQGLPTESPRAAFSNAFRMGWVSDETVWSDIIKARNNAVHVYHEALARQLTAELPRYLEAFQQLSAACGRALDGKIN